MPLAGAAVVLLGCGSERADVKTLSDSQAAEVDLVPDRGSPPALRCLKLGLRCFRSAALVVSSPCSLDVGEVRAAVDNRRQKLLFVLLINGMCETSAPAFRRIIQAQSARSF